MPAAFEVLNEPTRRRLLDALLHGERAVGELVEVVQLSQPAVSKHLRVLRDSGLVEARVDGPRRVYRLQLEPLRDVDTWLAPYRAMWSERLDLLESHLDAMPDDPTGER